MKQQRSGFMLKIKKMKATSNEKAFYEVFLNLGIDSKSLCHFIENVRNCPMYGSIFHIRGLDSNLKNILSKIYHNKLEMTINNIPAREFISRTWSL